jgi:hypothetical protein
MTVSLLASSDGKSPNSAALILFPLVGQTI